MKVVVLALLPAVLLAGCNKNKQAEAPPPAPAQAQAKPKPPAPTQQASKPAPTRVTGEASSSSSVVNTGSGGGGNSAAMAVRRGADNQTMRNDFRNIGQFYQAYVAEHGSGPKNLEEFLAYIQRDAPAIVKRFRDSTYTLNPQAQMSSNSILVYETNAWTDGTRNVLMGDGSVQKMGEQQIRQALGIR